MRRVTPKIPYPCIPARFSQMRDKYQRGEMRLWNDLDEILQLICSLCLPPLFSKTSARNIAAGGLTVCYVVSWRVALYGKLFMCTARSANNPMHGLHRLRVLTL